MNEKKKKKKVLWLTDDPWQASGYGMVTRNVLKRIKDDYEIHCVGLQHGGAIIEYDGYKVYPRMNHNDGYDILGPYAEKIKPDIIVTLKDVGLQEGYLGTVLELKKNNPSLKWYPYCPIDTNYLADGWEKVFSNADKVIAMSQWGKDKIKAQKGVVAELIPHGVDVDVFRPLKDEEQDPLNKQASWWNCFKVGSVGRNQQRKMWNQLVKGFAEFAKDKNDVALILHVDSKPIVNCDGWFLGLLAKKYGCEKKIVLTFPHLDVYTRFWIDDKKMNEVYNLFDVFCFPTGGEGFGIPLIEAQSSGKPVVTTDFTTGQELVGGHGLLVPTLKDSYGRSVHFEGQNCVEFHFPDDKEIAKALQKYYDDRKLMKKHGVESRKFAEKHYSWDNIAVLWKKLFDNGTVG
jgi:glycosyltransferase involved in cell wall biosynthesis